MQATPQVIDNIIDSQRIVDNKIKILCELFIKYSVHLILNKMESVRGVLVNCSKITNNEAKYQQDDRGLNSEANVKNVETIEDSSEEKDSVPSDQLVEVESKQNEAELIVDKSALDVEKSENDQKKEENKVEHEVSAEKGEKIEKQLSHREQLGKDLNELIKIANEQVIQVQKSMKVYLSSEDTEAILFKPIRNHIVKSINALFSQLSLVFGEQEKSFFNECEFKSSKSALEYILTNRTIK